MSISIQKLAPHRADHVGSFLRPETLKQARSNFEKGIITAKELRLVEDNLIIELIDKQYKAGLRVITDGEFRRSWWHFDFMKNFIGTRQIDGPAYQFNGVTTKGRLIEIYAPIIYNAEHPFFADFEFLQKHLPTNCIAKKTIPSPNMFFQANIRNTPIYQTIDELADDLAIAYKKTIEHLYKLGCRYIQLDDVYWATLVDKGQREEIVAEGLDPDKIAALATKLLNDILVDKPEDLIITLHVCRGNFNSAWIYSGGYDVVADYLFQVNVDGFFLEYDDQRSGDFTPLAKAKDKNIVLGLITSKVGEIEDPLLIKKRIEEASLYVPLDNLFLSPQCGFSSTEEGNKLAEEQQWEKVRFLVSLAKNVWGEDA